MQIILKPEGLQRMQTLTQAVTAWGNRPLLAPWVLVGLARVWKRRSNFWETEVNICLCSLAISHKNSFCGRDLSGQTVAKARHELPGALQGKVGLFPSWDQLPASGPRLAQWAGHHQAPAVACRHALKTVLIEGSGRGQWPLPAFSLLNCLWGLWGQCRTVTTRKLPANWGAAAGLAVPVASSSDSQTLKCCTGIMSVTFSCFMFSIYRQKKSEHNLPLSPEEGRSILWAEYFCPQSIELFLLSTPWVGEAQWLEETMCGNFVPCQKQ